MTKAAASQYSDENDRQLRTLLMTFFLKRVRERSEAEDLTQETLVRIVRTGDVGRANIPSYLFTVATNLVRDRARRSNSHRAGAHESLSNPHFSITEVATEDCGPERVLIGRETLQQVLQALSELEERTRDIFILFRMEKMKHREIAGLYSISVSAVEKHVVKATVYLTARLNRYG